MHATILSLFPLAAVWYEGIQDTGTYTLADVSVSHRVRNWRFHLSTVDDYERENTFASRLSARRGPDSQAPEETRVAPWFASAPIRPS